MGRRKKTKRPTKQERQRRELVSVQWALVKAYEVCAAQQAQIAALLTGLEPPAPPPLKFEGLPSVFDNEAADRGGNGAPDPEPRGQASVVFLRGLCALLGVVLLALLFWATGCGPASCPYTETEDGGAVVCVLGGPYCIDAKHSAFALPDGGVAVAACHFACVTNPADGGGECDSK